MVARARALPGRCGGGTSGGRHRRAPSPERLYADAAGHDVYVRVAEHDDQQHADKHDADEHDAHEHDDHEHDAYDDHGHHAHDDHGHHPGGGYHDAGSTDRPRHDTRVDDTYHVHDSGTLVLGPRKVQQAQDDNPR